MLRDRVQIGVGTRSPVVSVVMAVYNGEEFLDEAVRSILGQTFADFEFLVVNDGSTDRSREILSDFRDPRIRVLDNLHNLGLTPSLNRGLTEATGEFVARLDADDVAEPQRLAKQVAFLRARPEVSLVGTASLLMDRHGKSLGVSHVPCDHIDLRWSMMFYCPFYHSSVMWRRQLVRDEVGSYSAEFQYAMDYDLWIRIAARMTVANIPEPLVRYRLGAHSMTSTHPATSVELHRARLLSAAALLGSDSARFAEWEAASRQTFQINDGWLPQSGFPEVETVVTRIHEMHSNYCQNLGISPAEAHRSRRRADRWMAKRLLRAASHALATRRFRQGAALVRMALRLDPVALPMAPVWAMRFLAGRLGF